MVVAGERAQAVEDLVEEVLRMQLLHDLAVDAVAHLEHPLAVDALNGLGERWPRSAPAAGASCRSNAGSGA